MQNKGLSRFYDFTRNHIFLANLFFIISGFTLAVLLISGNSLKDIIQLGILLALVLYVTFAQQVVMVALQEITRRKAIYSAILSIVLCHEITRLFFQNFFLLYFRGGVLPNRIKIFFDLFTISDQLKMNLIVFALVIAGIVSTFSLFLLLLYAFNRSKVLYHQLFDHSSKESESNPTLIPSHRNKKTRFWISVVLLVIMLTVMVLFASSQSFWYDELEWSIGKVAGMNFVEICRQLLKDGYNMPLFYWILAILYRIMPYGEIYLLLPNILFILVGITLLYRVSQQLGGENVAFYSLVISTITTILLVMGAWELRPYALLFCTSTLTLLAYLSRRQAENWVNILFYAGSIILLLFSHWFGAIVILSYGLMDVSLWVKRKIQFKSFLSYILAGLVFLPWVVMVFLRVEQDLSAYWASQPMIFDFFSVILFLLSYNWITFLYFILSCWILWFTFLKERRNHSPSPLTSAFIQLMYSILFVIGIDYLYSRYINTNGSVFVFRYFIVLLPHVVLLLACSTDIVMKNLYHIAKLWKIPQKMLLLICITLFLIIGVMNYSNAIQSIKSVFQPYRETAQFLTNQALSFQDNTLIITSSAGESWIDYYIQKRHFDLPENIASGNTIENFHSKMLYTSPISLIVKNGIETDSTILTTNEILRYEHLYLFQNNNYFEKQFMQWVSQYYQLKYTNKQLHLVLYSKK